MRFRASLLILCGLLFVTLGLLAACGSVAEPQPTFEPTNTALFRAAHVQDEEGEATAESQPAEVAAEPTLVPPTVTPTSEPTAAPTEIPTEEPTPEPTQEPTEEPIAETLVIERNGVVGDASFGETFFNGVAKATYNGVEWQCSTCHQVAEPIPGTGPYLYGIGAAAALHGEEAGLSAIDYLYDSIVAPNHIIAPSQTGPDGTVYEWQPDVMPDNWLSVLGEQTVMDIVAYLMGQTQEDGHAH